MGKAAWLERRILNADAFPVAPSDAHKLKATVTRAAYYIDALTVARAVGSSDTPEKAGHALVSRLQTAHEKVFGGKPMARVVYFVCFDTYTPVAKGPENALRKHRKKDEAWSLHTVLNDRGQRGQYFKWLLDEWVHGRGLILPPNHIFCVVGIYVDPVFIMFENGEPVSWRVPDLRNYIAEGEMHVVWLHRLFATKRNFDISCWISIDTDVAIMHLLTYEQERRDACAYTHGRIMIGDQWLDVHALSPGTPTTTSIRGSDHLEFLWGGVQPAFMEAPVEPHPLVPQAVERTLPADRPAMYLLHKRVHGPWIDTQEWFSGVFDRVNKERKKQRAWSLKQDAPGPWKEFEETVACMADEHVMRDRTVKLPHKWYLESSYPIMPDICALYAASSDYTHAHIPHWTPLKIWSAWTRGSWNVRPLCVTPGIVDVKRVRRFVYELAAQLYSHNYNGSCTLRSTVERMHAAWAMPRPPGEIPTEVCLEGMVEQMVWSWHYMMYGGHARVPYGLAYDKGFVKVDADLPWTPANARWPD